MVKVIIESMSCKSCVVNIEESLKEADHNAIVRANLREKSVFVESNLSDEKVLEVIRDIGYEGIVKE